MLAEMAELNDPVLLAPRQTAHNQQISSTSDQHQASGTEEVRGRNPAWGLVDGEQINLIRSRTHSFQVWTGQMI
jgi:hypothetical protein